MLTWGFYGNFYTESSMSDIILVPIHVDALCLKNGQSVTEATANFDRLPYFNGNRDVYSSTINLSESIVSQPFQNQNLYLKPGIHLHWALPNALTTGVQSDKGIEFPAAPDRWLIIRRQNSKETGRWVIESTYLHDPKNNYQENSITYPITYPYTDEKFRKNAPRFCYLGRQLKWDDWLKKKNDSENKYLDKITAIGYGEPTFAAFYPNCRSVFGFYDSFDNDFTSAEKVEYDVIGWYSNSEQDYLKKVGEKFIKQGDPPIEGLNENFTKKEIQEYFKNQEFLNYLRETGKTDFLKKINDNTLFSSIYTDYRDKLESIQELKIYLLQKSEQLKEYLQGNLKWNVSDLQSSDNQMICYARLSFKNTNLSKIDRQASVSLAIGNTGGEALAAYLAHSIAKDKNQQTILEEQLALIDLTDDIDNLNSDRPDFGAIFQQRQHQNSFNGLVGGLIWQITVTKGSNQQENNNNSSAIGLPLHLMTELNELNQKQQEYNRNREEIDSMRYQIFSDWYKYMVSCYAVDRWDDYPNVDEIKKYIEKCGLKTLSDKIAATGELKVEQDSLGNLKLKKDASNNFISASANPANPANPANSSNSNISNISCDLATKINRLLENIEKYNQKCNNYDGILLHIKPDRNANNNIVDISDRNRTIDKKGNPAIVSQEKFGCCIKFENTGDRLDLGSFTNVTSNAITLAVWITVPSNTSSSIVICESDSTKKVFLKINNGQYQFGSSEGTDNYACAAIAKDEIGTWVHLTGVYDSTIWKLYKNGQEIVSKNNEINPNIVKDNWKYIWTIAADKDGKNNFQGQMAHFRLYDRALSSAEINKILDNLTTITYKLERVADARYWQPKEPVVLIVEDNNNNSKALKSTDRYDRNEVLGCTSLLNKTIDNLIRENFQSVVEKINALSKNDDKKFYGFQTWKQQPWNPFLLEWLVEIFPVKAPKNSSSNRRFGRNFLTENYVLAEHDFELSPKSNYHVLIQEKQINHIITDNDFNTYSGSSILTPYAAVALQQKLNQYKYPQGESETIGNPVYKAIESLINIIEKGSCDRQLEAYIRARIPHNYDRYNDAVKIDEEDFFGQPGNLQDLKTWYEKQQLTTIPSFSKTVTDAKERLSKINCLSQALGGFNAALLMHKQTLQLNIDDPIGFEDYQKFTEKVRDAVAECSVVAPQPLERFNPVRSGEMRIIDLQLIDTFGQVKELKYKDTIAPKAMRSEKKERIYLPPRLVQPIRINFDWLPAEVFSQENHENLSDFTPICGWIVPNNLDHSLFIYSNTGEALGSIEPGGKWMVAPGSSIKKPDEIANLHLKKMVNKLCQLGKESQDFINHFESTLNNALENIELEQVTQSSLVSLLVGRPIAVVRASVDLELRGLPAVNQNWQIFRQDMQLNRKNECKGDRRNSKTERETDGFTEVEFPIRIGEYQQFNDGVIGYWKEEKDDKAVGGYKYEDDVFYAQQSDEVESPHIETQYWDPNTNQKIAEAPINIIQSLDSPPQTLTMLIDPRHQIHISAGILPTKVVTIPPEQYVPILEAIQVSFLTSPLLSDRDSYNFPLPKIPQYSWTWLENQKKQWQKIYDFPTIERSIWEENADFLVVDRHQRVQAWDLLTQANWLKEMPEETGKEETGKAVVIPKSDRPKDKEGKLIPLDGILKDLDEKIDLFFDLYQVGLIPTSIQANFTETQKIREGWLVLKKVKDGQGS